MEDILLSEHLPYVKRHHLLASAVKLMFCGLCPFFYKIGAIICSKDSTRLQCYLHTVAACLVLFNDTLSTAHVRTYTLPSRGSIMLWQKLKKPGMSYMTLNLQYFFFLQKLSKMRLNFRKHHQGEIRTVDLSNMKRRWPPHKHVWPVDGLMINIGEIKETEDIQR